MTIEFTVLYPVRKSAWTKRYGLNAYWAGKKPPRPGGGRQRP